MSQPVLEVSRLSGGYHMASSVLHEITFQVHPGEMVGLIGLNGAGKSTTLKMILGLLKPRSGEIRIQGVTLEENEAQYRSACAYIPEQPLLYDELEVAEHLRLAAMAYEVDEPLFSRRSGELLESFQMTPHAGKLPRQLSKGMMQKTMVMSALLPSAPLYLIDEPFLGLDPLGIRTMQKHMLQLTRQGAGLLVSSHLLPTLQDHCRRYVVLHQGRIKAAGTFQELRDKAVLPQGNLEEVYCRLLEEDEE